MGIFYAKSPFPDFSPISGYRDLQNIKLHRNNAFGARVSSQILPPGVCSENTENEFLMEQKGIFYTESPCPDFIPLSRYRDLQNIILDQHNTFWARLSMQFSLVGVGSENNENEFLI